MQRLGEKEALASLGDITARWSHDAWGAEEWAKDYSTDERRDMAKKGHALSDGSYPIKNASDLQNAARLAASGKGNASAAKALIRKRAKALGVKVESLPGFGTEKSADAHDAAVQRSIEDTIRLQESDPDQDAQDKRVLALLKQALAAQQQDTD